MPRTQGLPALVKQLLRDIINPKSHLVTTITYVVRDIILRPVLALAAHVQRPFLQDKPAAFHVCPDCTQKMVRVSLHP
jgi:hypothetical protein